MINTGWRWRALRESLNMDQAEFAEMANTSRSTISRVERNKSSLRSENIAAIEAELGMPIHQAMQLAAEHSEHWIAVYVRMPPEKRAALDGIIQAAIEALNSLDTPTKQP